MKKEILLVALLLFVVCPKMLHALEYPGTAPGTAHCSVADGSAILSNAAISGEWQFDAGRITSLTLKNLHTGQSLVFEAGHLPSVLLPGGRRVDLASLSPIEPLSPGQHDIVAVFKDAPSGLAMRWSVSLDDGSNAIIQSLQIRASRDTEIEELVFIDSPLDSARQMGSVDGSVVVCGDLFLAIEHPLAKNKVGNHGHVSCLLPRGNVLKAGQSWTYTSVFGAVPPGQLRRGFLYYLERRRAQPYRPFLHYNNWYNVYLARPVERTNETECLESIDLFVRKLINERDVKMDAFVWDDGWDDFNSLWDFHKGFPDGYRKLMAAGNKYGVSQGVWMSPWGGYGPAKEKRIAYGKSQGYETNESGFSMAGAKYGKAFRDVCLHMMQEQGVTFFKFDGMGGGNKATGADAEMDDDIDAVLDLTQALRGENPQVFISATIGTWASPFWLFYASSIWRQGGDHGFYGKGDTRQQWITYRDMNCYERIVQLGPLYPLNSLMLGGIIIGDRRSPAQIVRNEKSVADEIWSFFGSGTCLQELYINPKLPTETMWDELAAAANWSRANSDVLVDVHWIGGDPGKEEVYGWASWRPGKGILVLRNPSESPQGFKISPTTALALPEGITGTMNQRTIYPRGRQLTSGPSKVGEPISMTLKPFEVLVIELSDQTMEKIKLD
jgi:hypothetical protein